MYVYMYVYIYIYIMSLHGPSVSLTSGNSSVDDMRKAQESGLGMTQLSWNLGADRNPNRTWRSKDPYMVLYGIEYICYLLYGVEYMVYGLVYGMYLEVQGSYSQTISVAINYV